MFTSSHYNVHYTSCSKTKKEWLAAVSPKCQAMSCILTKVTMFFLLSADGKKCLDVTHAAQKAKQKKM